MVFIDELINSCNEAGLTKVNADFDDIVETRTVSSFTV